MGLTLEELRPVLDLMNENNEQLHKAIKERSDRTCELIDVRLKGLIKEIYGLRRELKNHNGRLNRVETAQIVTASTCLERGLNCAKDIRKMNTIIGITGILEKIQKNWKMSLFIFILLIIGIQILVAEAISHNWLDELLKLIKP